MALLGFLAKNFKAHANFDIVIKNSLQQHVNMQSKTFKTLFRTCIHEKKSKFS